MEFVTLILIRSVEIITQIVTSPREDQNKWAQAVWIS